MFTAALLMLSHYKPLKLSPDMYFLSYNEKEDIVELFQANSLKITTLEDFVSKYGYPVNFYIIDVNTLETLATEEAIAWVDDPKLEFYRDLSVKDINRIMNECNSELYVELGDNGKPVILADKVVIRLPFDLENVLTGTLTRSNSILRWSIEFVPEGEEKPISLYVCDVDGYELDDEYKDGDFPEEGIPVEFVINDIETYPVAKILNIIDDHEEEEEHYEQEPE